MWSISYVAVAPLRLLVLRLIGFFRVLNVSSHFLICVLRDYPHLCVSYGALSATMYVCVLWSSLRHYVCVLRLTGMYSTLALPYLCLTGLSLALCLCPMELSPALFLIVV